MTILDRIVLYKKDEVLAAKRRVSEHELKDQKYFASRSPRLKDFLLDRSKNGIISEYKRASPSKGLINGHSPVQDVVKAYQEAQVSAISVLTDGPSFQGKLDDLIQARAAVKIPILRKDFIVDPFQILESKAYGADIILLIAAILEPSQIEEYAAFAQEIGLSVLLEVHTENELAKNLWKGIDAIGINNRNLHDFSVSISHSLDLVDQIPDAYLKISESGISDSEIIKKLKESGFHGFLIGENFMKSQDPALAIQEFTYTLNQKYL